MTLLKHLVCLLFLTYSLTSFSQVITYTCTYNYGNNTEYIGTTTLLNKISISKKNNDLQYTFVINNVKNMNEVDDYVEIKNKKGQKITYPMSCK